MTRTVRGLLTDWSDAATAERVLVAMRNLLPPGGEVELRVGLPMRRRGRVPVVELTMTHRGRRGRA